MGIITLVKNYMLKTKYYEQLHKRLLKKRKTIEMDMKKVTIRHVAIRLYRSR